MNHAEDSFVPSDRARRESAGQLAQLLQERYPEQYARLTQCLEAGEFGKAQCILAGLAGNPDIRKLILGREE